MVDLTIPLIYAKFSLNILSNNKTQEMTIVMSASKNHQNQFVEQGISTQDLTHTNQTLLWNSRQYWIDYISNQHWLVGCLPQAPPCRDCW